MIKPGGYDPHDHAHRLGIDVVYGTLRTANGLWLPDRNVIILKPGMRSLLERTVLAHEVGHAALGHRESTPRTERQADRYAAQHLLCRDDVERVALLSPDPGAWCVELGVTPHILETYLRDNPTA
jgi:Zn-dependent peptidase ImmA (M78 family)